MTLTTRLGLAVAFAALAACGSKNTANNTAEMNYATDMNAGMTDLNTTTEMNATDMNATGNVDMNAMGNADMNATTNNGM